MDDVREPLREYSFNALSLFLSRGGLIYAEGNAAYLLESLGLLAVGSVDLENSIDGTFPGMNSIVSSDDSDHPLGFTPYSNKLYTLSAPTLSEYGRVILRYNTAFRASDVGKAACVEYSSMGGRIIAMGALPTSKIYSTETHWQYTANAVYSGFLSKLSLSRSIQSTFVTDSADISPMCLPVGAAFEFTVTIRNRKLWETEIAGATLTETVDEFYRYISTTSGVSPSTSGNTLTYALPTLAPNSSYTIRYRLSTPDEGDVKWNNINTYLDSLEYMYVSNGRISYFDAGFSSPVNEYRHFLKVRYLFEADLVADTDLNWKNILGEYYQPFKIFMITENKERTAAYHTRYVQYIPLDVPIYWLIDVDSDNQDTRWNIC
jgi:hypothetical protein